MKKMLLLLTLAMVLSVPASAATVAYWRFEAGPADTAIQSSAVGPTWSSDVPDVTGNGNDLSAWDSNQFIYRDDPLPYTNVLQTGAVNNFCLRNAQDNPTLWTDKLQTWSPAQFTIEATFKSQQDGANGGWKTLVGRDSRNIAMQGTETNGDLAALYFQTTDNPANGLAIKFIDSDGYWHSAELGNAYIGFDNATDPDGTTAPWYSLAGVSDGTLLSLYLYNHDEPENGYVLIAQTDMTVVNPGSTDTSLNVGAGSGGDWIAGNITVGRGMYAGGHGDRWHGFIDEVRLSDTALPVSRFLMSPGFVQPVSPEQDEYLLAQDPISYTWTSDIPAEVMFTHYTIHIAGDPADLAPAVPTTTLHSAEITNIATTSYSGYTGTYDYNEDYYWRIDMTALEPNDADPNNIVNDIERLYQGAPVRFYGPRACPVVTMTNDDVAIMPDPVTQIYTADDAVFTADITRGTVEVDAISWYKVVGVQDDLDIVDPNDTPDIEITNVAGVSEITFDPDLATASSTTLTIVSAEVSDNGEYYARVRLVDPLGGGSGCEKNSATTRYLFVRDDTNSGTNYLVHRYGFDSDASDSIGGAHGVVADINDPNHVFGGGQLTLLNGDLGSRPIEPLEIPDPTPEDPNATITVQQVLDQEGAYVDLPNGMISALEKSATIMVWFTYDSADSGNWPRVYDFGTSTGGEGFSTGGDGILYYEGIPYLNTASDDLQEYTMLCPKNGGGPNWQVETTSRESGGATVWQENNDAVASGTEVCVTYVFDAPNNTQTLYVNGVEVGQNSTAVDLAELDDVNNWIGRSQWPDAMFTGSINELRIYDIPLSKYWVKAYSDQGPDDYTTLPNPCVEEEPNPMDFNTDCQVDIQDFADFAAQWLNCNALYGC